jgi:hypothetical protein
MKNVIKSYNAAGLCGTCYRELPALIEYRDDGCAYITKTCPDHGYEEAMIEKSWEFLESVPQLNPNNPTWQTYNDVVMVEVTDRCNVNCKHCYHRPDNKSKDLPADFIVAKALSHQESNVCLIGAEPTMREDLCEIISKITNSEFHKDAPRRVLIYTNGVKLNDMKYVQQLKAAGLSSINMSIHNPDYHNPKIWEQISQGIKNVVRSNIDLGQISFTVENKQQAEYAVDRIMWFKRYCRIPFNFCIRSPADIGTELLPEDEIFASELVNWLTEITAAKKLKFERCENHGSNPYHVAHMLEGMVVQVIHWASAKSIDTRWMNMGPWATFVPNTKGTFLIQAILRDGWKKGWWQGQRLSPAIQESTISFIRKPT